MAQVEDPDPQRQWGQVLTQALELCILNIRPDGLCWPYSVLTAAGIGTDLDAHGQSPAAADSLLRRVAEHIRRSKNMITQWSAPLTVGEYILERINLDGLKLQAVPLGATSMNNYRVQSVDEFADLLEDRTGTYAGIYFINYYPTVQQDCIIFLTAEVINRRITIVNDKREFLCSYEPTVNPAHGQKALGPEIFIMFTEGRPDGRGGHFDALVGAAALPHLQEAAALLNVRQAATFKPEVEALLLSNGFNLPKITTAYDLSRLNSAFLQLRREEVRRRISTLQGSNAAPQPQPPAPLGDYERAELAHRETVRLQEERDADEERIRSREAAEAARQRTADLTLRLVRDTFDERAERRLTSRRDRMVLLQQRIQFITDLSTSIINADAAQDAKEWIRLLHLLFEALGPPENYLINNMPKESSTHTAPADHDSDDDDDDPGDGPTGPTSAAEEQKNAKVLAKAIHFLQASKENGVNLSLLLNLDPPKELTSEAIALLQSKHPEPTRPQSGPRPPSHYDHRADIEPLNVQWDNPNHRDNPDSVPGIKQILFSAKPHVADLARVSFTSIVNIINAGPTIISTAITHVTRAIAEGLPAYVVSGSPEYNEGARLVGTYLGMAICKIKDFKDTGDLRPILKLYRLVALVDAWLIAHPVVKRFFSDHTPTWQLYFQQAGTEAMALAIGELMSYLKSEHPEGYHATCDLENCFNLLDWEAIIELCDLCPVLSRFVRLLYGNGPQRVHYRCLITGKEVLILNKTGGAQGAGLTAYLAAALLAPPQHLVALLFDCGSLQGPSSDHHNTFMAFCDDGHASSTQADTCARMVLFMADNDPKYLTEEQKQRLPQALDAVFSKYKTRRTSLCSIGQKLKLSKLCVYSHHIMNAAHRAFFENLEVPSYMGSGTFSFKFIPPSEGIKVTGVPKGDRLYQEAWAKKTCNNIVTLIETIPPMLTRGIGESHRRVFLNYILRTGIATKLQFLMANIPRIASHGLRDVLKAYRIALTAVFDLVPEEALSYDDMHDARWLRTHLPEDQGGTAHTNPLDVQYAAYIGMLARTAPLLPALIPTVPVEWLTSNHNGPRTEASQALELLQRQLKGKPLNDFLSERKDKFKFEALIKGAPISYAQHLLSDLVHESRRIEAEERLPMHRPNTNADSDKDTALFRAQFLAGVLRKWAEKGNDTILTTSIFTAHPLNPVSPNDSVLIYHALMRGGWSFNSHGAQHTCRYCNLPIPPQQLLHHHNCTGRANSTGTTERHNALVSALLQFARLKGAWVPAERAFRGEPFLRNIFPDFQLKAHLQASLDARADWHIQTRSATYNSNGHLTIRVNHLYGDARVSSVTAASLDRVLHSLGTAAQYGEDKKIEEYNKRYDGIAFNHPTGVGSTKDPNPCIHLLVIDTFLRVGRRSSRTIRALASCLASQGAHMQVVLSRFTYGAIYSELKRILALTMQNYTAEAYYSSLSRDRLYANAFPPLPPPLPPAPPTGGRPPPTSQKRKRRQDGAPPPPQAQQSPQDPQNSPQDDTNEENRAEHRATDSLAPEQPASATPQRRTRWDNPPADNAPTSPAPAPAPAPARQRTSRSKPKPNPLQQITATTPTPARPRAGQATLLMVRPPGVDPASGPFLTEDDIEPGVEFNADQLGEAHYARDENGFTFAGFIATERPEATPAAQHLQDFPNHRLRLINEVAALVRERFPGHEPALDFIENRLDRRNFLESAIEEVAGDYINDANLVREQPRSDTAPTATTHPRQPLPATSAETPPASGPTSARTSPRWASVLPGPAARTPTAPAASPAAASVATTTAASPTPATTQPPTPTAAAASAPPTRPPPTRQASTKAVANIQRYSQDLLADSDGQEEDADDGSEASIHSSSDDDYSDDYSDSDNDSEQGNHCASPPRTSHPTAASSTQDTRPFYAVRAGRVTGVFRTWEECDNSVKGFRGNNYKSFKTLQEAEEFINGTTSHKRKRPTSSEPTQRPPPGKRDDDDDGNGSGPQPFQYPTRQHITLAPSSPSTPAAASTTNSSSRAGTKTHMQQCNESTAIRNLSPADRALIEKIIIDYGQSIPGKINWDVLCQHLPEGPLRQLPRKALYKLKSLAYRDHPGGMREQKRNHFQEIKNEGGARYEALKQSNYRYINENGGKERKQKQQKRYRTLAKLQPDYADKQRAKYIRDKQKLKDRRAADPAFDREYKDKGNLRFKEYKARRKAEKAAKEDTISA